MNYYIETNLSDQTLNIEVALKIIDSDAMLTSSESGVKVVIILEQENFTITVSAPTLLPAEEPWQYHDQNIFDPRYREPDKKQRRKELVRLGIVKVIGEYFKKEPQWGILSAVRPSKIYHHLQEKGFSNTEIREILLNVYAIAPEKVALLIAVGSSQTKFFKPHNYISLYVGIPFCPTRCRYCSFAAYSLETHRHLVANFLKGLETEIQATGNLCREMDFTIESIYLGGGTPTSLTEGEFALVLEWLRQSIFTEEIVEFTVEAGRPETISKPKLQAMIKAGVNRISINPQSMQNRTLKMIGRNHTVEQIYQAVGMVRQETDFVVNMDLIMGLPGETGDLFQDSLQKVIELQPDNITVHTLAPKRAADWRKQFNMLGCAEDGELLNINRQTISVLSQYQYLPYYLYRQRLILADLENIGYAKPGNESIYNIQMMEERQSIIGIGGGAVTKWVTGPEHIVTRHQNPKCPATYYQRLPEEIAKKAQQTRLLLS